jgi:uncharacterized SAM-binding protein YcdF (DUF218 family)
LLILLLVLCGTIASAIFTWGILFIIAKDLQRRGHAERPSIADTAIVLGAYTNGFRPSPALQRRLCAALHLFRAGVVRTFVVSGGQGPDESISESKSMRRFLILNGVPPHLVYEEKHSTDTWENLRNSQVVMAQRGLRKAVIVTSDYHLPRALAVARHLEMEVSGYAAKSSPRELHYALREVLAHIEYTMRGRTSR